MKIKTSDTTPIQINWLVAKIEEARIGEGYYTGSVLRGNYEPSTDWFLGGSIIDRIEGFQLKTWLQSRPDSKCEAHIHNYDGDWIQFGPTPLIAAMRCFIASRLGDEVEVPEELK